ncbi:hypothetical protein [Verrucosispora sp. NA02020]|uniref:hypothetical protein n=1 Tax=Verrucosispora sp. NA02020 TaxID=2742132 RepID=UPI003D752242
MPTVHLVRGQVPVDSPARALVGRTVTMPATTREQLAARVSELRAARVVPVTLSVEV